MTRARAAVLAASVVLLPWAVVLAVVAAAFAPPTRAEAAPRVDRFVQLRIGDVSVGIAAAGTRLRCVSAVTGTGRARISVSIGRHPVWTGRRVAPHTETGCVGNPYGLHVPRGAYVYLRTTAGGPVTRTRLP